MHILLIVSQCRRKLGTVPVSVEKKVWQSWGWAEERGDPRSNLPLYCPGGSESGECVWRKLGAVSVENKYGRAEVEWRRGMIWRIGRQEADTAVSIWKHKKKNIKHKLWYLKLGGGVTDPNRNLVLIRPLDPGSGMEKNPESGCRILGWWSSLILLLRT